MYEMYMCTFVYKLTKFTKLKERCRGHLPDNFDMRGDVGHDMRGDVRRRT